QEYRCPDDNILSASQAWYRFSPIFPHENVPYRTGEDFQVHIVFALYSRWSSLPASSLMISSPVGSTSILAVLPPVYLAVSAVRSVFLSGLMALSILPTELCWLAV